MRYLALFTFFMIAWLPDSISQDKKPLSPPMTLEAEMEGVSVVINYNAPSRRDRDIWGALVPYNEVWRTGANSATKITLGEDVKIEGEALAKGTYSLFTIPGEDKCTVIINSVANQWGSYSYDSKKDVLRVEVAPVALDELVETMTFEQDENKIMLKWERVGIPITISK